MRKLLITVTLIALILPAANAQLTKVGGAVGYNHAYYFNNSSDPDHKLKNPVFTFTGIYEINLPFHISPRINIYFPNIYKEGDASNSYKEITTGYSIDVDGHYVFNSLDKFEIYGLAGLNFLYARRKSVSESIDLPEPFKEVSSNTALGLNIGAGSYIKVKEQFDLFVELKAILASQIQFVGTAGILLNIDWLKKNEETAF